MPASLSGILLVPVTFIINYSAKILTANCFSLNPYSRMGNTRRWIVLTLYSCSVVLSACLFFLAGVYCQVAGGLASCSLSWAERNRQYAQFFPICASCLVLLLSLCWLISNLRRVETSCMRDYSFLEMPSAVGSCLLAGVCAVIEIHYNFDYSYLYWSEKWALAAADSVILVFLHAGLAFALT
ncbi:hypothetical protein Ddc_15116 [Ditylenchus destructor]|nr:hypothetical protein Ddc_15116 [Ditylenchus destructor]